MKYQINSNNNLASKKLKPNLYVDFQKAKSDKHISKQNFLYKLTTEELQGIYRALLQSSSLWTW